jgi:hypothetical protein
LAAHRTHGMPPKERRGVFHDSGRVVGLSEVVLRIAEERAVCSGRLKRKRDTFLPLPEHAIADLHEFRVRLNIGLQIL